MGFYLQGLTMGLAYIAPIGMQNLFVINSALTKTRRHALLTALIVIVFDVSLSLSCFFGIGTLMQRYDWLRLAVLAVGGVVVIGIGGGLLRQRVDADSAPHAAVTSDARTAAHTDTDVARSSDRMASGKSGKGLGTLGGFLGKTISTACVVTWFNPQAIIDGTLMLGAFSATLTASQSTPFITGVETASIAWFIGVTLLVSAFRNRFSPKVIGVLNKVCGAVIIAYGVKLLVQFALAVI
ncbi:MULTISPECIES: LysE/ArgO family amino acid transporter [Bifidobacterium]|uniref:Amino acid transporter n=1 Tax=Bifidobacterium tissieri TaxID=1630162 RepID=A0A261FHS7_9BIFI|nr:MULTISPECIES: LysE family transporter [Bifidobacterium]KAA8831204.1 amino acid transporter [Bifidobacterium tissieri]KAA8833142.1 amino acid transporter [Bifidobacterium tissieri]OZG58710.1 translocator protein, LysE family [Bifidobacterium tissieri]TPF97865.1 L-lysine permease [Bifidobacterium sp. UTCIF-39]